MLLRFITFLIFATTGFGALLSQCRGSAACVRGRSDSPMMQHSKGWDGFGKGPFKYYNSFEEFMKPFPDEDRDQYPEMFVLPKGVYEVALKKPLGIAFEEVEPGRGVLVTELVEGGSAVEDGTIQPGDILIAVTAVKVFGPRWERKLVPAKNLDFDTVIAAIGSNIPRWKAYDVVMQFERPSVADPAEVKSFLEFFEIPYDHVFKTG